MPFKVKPKKSALKFIESLDLKRKQTIKEAILTLKEEPVPAGKYDIIKLGGHDSYYRIRIGQVRLAYEVLWDEKLIVIHYAGWRGPAYKNL